MRKENDLLNDHIFSEFLGEDLEAMPDDELYDFAANQDIDTTGFSRMEVIARILEVSEDRIRQTCIDEGINPAGMGRDEMLKEIFRRFSRPSR